MSVKQLKKSKTSNLSVNIATKEGLSNTANTMVNISTKQVISTTLLSIISVSMIAIGGMYLKECPVGKYIPVYLLVGGMMGLLKILLSVQSGVHSDPNHQTVLRRALTETSSKSSSLINCFMLCWFCIGSYWIYSIYEPEYQRDCHKTLYLFAFWLVTLMYLSVGAIVFVAFLIFIVKCFSYCVAKLRSNTKEVLPSDV